MTTIPQKIANNGAESNDIELMLESFYKSKEIHFTTLTGMSMSLLHLKDNQNESHQSESTITVSTIKTQSGKPINTPISDNPSISKVERKAKLERVERRMKKNGYIIHFHSLDCDPSFLFFLLCPEIIWCDVTSHLNNKGYSLLTFLYQT